MLLHRFALGAVLIAASLLAYWPSMHGEYLWDDDAHVSQNVLLRDSQGLRMIWTRIGATPQYYPLTHTSFWLQTIGHNRQNGPPDSFPFHLVNSLLHGASGILLWMILQRLGLNLAYPVALIFVLHPVHVESVAWISERKNVLSGFFYLAASYTFLAAAGVGMTQRAVRRTHVWFAISFLLFAAAVLSKTVAGTLPAALALLLWWKKKGISRKEIAWLVSMLLVAVVFSRITAGMEGTIVGAKGAEWNLSFLQRVLIAANALQFYVIKLLWPVNLSFNYQRWNIDVTDLRLWIAPFFVMAVTGLLLLYRHRLGRGPIVGWLFFCGTLFPALGFVNVYPMRFSFVADHFQYLASIGILAIVGEIVFHLPRLACEWKSRLLIALAMILGLAAWQRSCRFASAEALWLDTLEKNPRSWLAYGQLGNLYLQRGDAAAALGALTQSAKLNPSQMEAHRDLAELYLRLRQPEPALRSAQRAVEVRSDNPLTYYTLARVYDAAGDELAAENALRQSLLAAPKFEPARLKLSAKLKSAGRLDEAVTLWREGVAAFPEGTRAKVELAEALVAKGELAEAMKYYQDAANHASPASATVIRDRMQQIQGNP